VVGRKLLSRPKCSRNEAVEPYEEDSAVSIATGYGLNDGSEFKSK
jgi:hypothetical protein